MPCRGHPKCRPEAALGELDDLVTEEGRTVTSVMEEALRSFLKVTEPEPQPFVLKTLPERANAAKPVDVGNNAAIRELLDAEDPQGFHANA